MLIIISATRDRWTIYPFTLLMFMSWHPLQHDSVSRSSESSRSVEAPRTPEISHSINGLAVKERKESRDSKSSDKKSNKAWYKMLNPTYKSRSEDLKRLFKDLPSDERLIVGLYLSAPLVSLILTLLAGS